MQTNAKNIIQKMQNTKINKNEMQKQMQKAMQNKFKIPKHICRNEELNNPKIHYRYVVPKLMEFQNSNINNFR